MAPWRVFVVGAAGAGTLLAGFNSGGAAIGPERGRPVRPAQPVSTARPSRGVSLIGVARAGFLLVYGRPGGRRPELRLSGRTFAGTRRVLLVRQEQAGWTEVWLPIRPNGARGWVKMRYLAVAYDDWRVIVRLHSHWIVVLHDGRERWRARIADGAAATPTPRGHFFVTELLRQPDPAGAYGPWVFALSAFSRVLTHFRGGDGEIGIHGTNQPWLLGRRASHGCIRLRNSDIARLARMLPLGTPVDVSAA